MLAIIPQVKNKLSVIPTRKEKKMENAIITAENLIETKVLRDEVIHRTEVLDKVKQLFLIPKMECMTIRQVADYFEVDYNTVKLCYQRNESEIESDGVTIRTPQNFKEIFKGTSCTFKNLEQKNGKLIVTLENNITLEIPNRGIRVFSKRAVLRIAMLLRDSEIAKEVRTQLLNTFEHSTAEQRTIEIDEETRLLNGIGYAFGKGTNIDILQACMQLDQYRKRYIAEIETQKTELANKNEEIDKQNKALSAENKILAAEILNWTDRASANRITRVLAALCFKGDFKLAYNIIYKQMLYKYGISVNKRCMEDGKKHPRISYIKDNEWIYFYKTVFALCEEKKIDSKKLFDDAMIDISTLQLN